MPSELRKETTKKVELGGLEAWFLRQASYLRDSTIRLVKPVFGEMEPSSLHVRY